MACLQIAVGFIVELFTLVPSLIIIQLFRRTRPRSSSVVTSKKSLPHWFLYITYALCLVLVGLSMFFIIARGIEFGDEKSFRWLISILTGFFSSILFIQPIQVMLEL